MGRYFRQQLVDSLDGGFSRTTGYKPTPKYTNPAYRHSHFCMQKLAAPPVFRCVAQYPGPLCNEHGNCQPSNHHAWFFGPGNIGQSGLNPLRSERTGEQEPMCKIHIDPTFVFLSAGEQETCTKLKRPPYGRGLITLEIDTKRHYYGSNPNDMFCPILSGYTCLWA